MTVFERALARAAFSVRFTEGYNPKPRLEFANPLSLGVDSEEEIAGIDLHDENPAEDFPRRMNAALPAGMRVLRAQTFADTPGARRRSLMSLYWGGDFDVQRGSEEPSVIRLPATGPSIRKTLEAEGTWMSARTRRVATWAVGIHGEPVSYFDALGSIPVAGS